MILRNLTLGLIGGGAIAKGLLELIARDGGIARLVILLRDGELSARAADLTPLFDMAAQEWTITDDIRKLVDACPIVIEAAGHEALQDYGPAVVGGGKKLIAVSSGAFADRSFQSTMSTLAAKHGGQVIVPSGAIGAIDIISAMAVGDPEIEIFYTGVKPPSAWLSAPQVDPVRLAALDHAEVIFEGTARAAASAFPQNANVAATVALAASSFSRVKVKLVADPSAEGNSHRLEISTRGGRMAFSVDARPAKGKPGTSETTALSVFHTLRRLFAPISI